MAALSRSGAFLKCQINYQGLNQGNWGLGEKDARGGGGRGEERERERRKVERAEKCAGTGEICLSEYFAFSTSERLAEKQ